MLDFGRFGFLNKNAYKIYNIYVNSLFFTMLILYGELGAP